MKTLLKYITLLLVSGVIIPLYQQTTGSVKTGPVIKPVTTLITDTPIRQDGAFHFSFINDVAAKILPVVNFFK
ncbi:MAG: hypothetical protein V4592_06660 [Bacteroidota bacterium]